MGNTQSQSGSVGFIIHCLVLPCCSNCKASAGFLGDHERLKRHSVLFPCQKSILKSGQAGALLGRSGALRRAPSLRSSGSVPARVGPWFHGASGRLLHTPPMLGSEGLLVAWVPL